MISLNPALGAGAVVAIRVAVVVAALLLRRRRELVRRVAFGGAALASAIAGLTAATALRGGGASRDVFFVHHASGFSLDYAIDPLSAWFLIVLSVLAVPDRDLQHWLRATSSARWTIGLSWHRLQRAAVRGRARVRRGRRDRVPVRLGADDAGDGCAGGDRARSPRDATGRLSVPGHVTRGDRCYSSPHSSSSRPRRDRSRSRRYSPAERSPVLFATSSSCCSSSVSA